MRLVVVGGGISGLAAAWSARLCAQEFDVSGALDIVVCERAREVGGKAQTVERPDWRIEAGPTGFLDNEPVLDRLVEASGLTKLPAEAASARRFLVRGGKLREIRPHPLKFATSGILSPGGLMRLAAESFVPQKTDDTDESIWEFARRRLGSQAADRLIAPMVLGVFAGDARKLSLRSAFPRMAELERDHGGLFRAMRALRRRGGQGGPAGPGAALTSFADGLQSLPRALAERGEFTVRTETSVERIEHAGASADEGAWALRCESRAEPLRADAVVVATEPWAAAPMLSGSAPGISSELAGIDCPGVAVVGLGFGAEALARVPRGFGVLIPRTESYRILGVLWDTHLFAGRSAEGTLLVRAMLGGSTDPGIAKLDRSELVQIARSDVARLFGLRAAPIFEHATLWPRAIPQYAIGHAQRVERIDAELAAMSAEQGGLYLAGNALEGVAFGKAAALGWRRGREAVEALASRRR